MSLKVNETINRAKHSVLINIQAVIKTLITIFSSTFLEELFYQEVKGHNHLQDNAREVAGSASNINKLLPSH